MDHAGPSIGQTLQQDHDVPLAHLHDEVMTPALPQHIQEDPNSEAQGFYNMLEASRASLWDGCETHSELSASLQALSIKSDHQLSEACFNRWLKLMKETMPSGNHMPTNHYYAKKSVASLGLGVEKIDCCKNGCMLFHNEYAHESVNICRFCGEERYKVTTRRGIERKTPKKKCGTSQLLRGCKECIPQWPLHLICDGIVRTTEIRMCCVILLMD